MLAKHGPRHIHLRKLGAPELVMLGRVGVDGFVAPAMSLQICLAIAIEIEAAKPDRAGHGRVEIPGEYVAIPLATGARRISGPFLFLKRGELFLEASHRVEIKEGPPTHASHADCR